MMQKQGCDWTRWFAGCSAVAVLVAMTTLPLTGCNTVEGFGKDLETAGKAISDRSERARSE
ncbi:entericidin A/B family lipoprotein [Phycisphaerales bacterium AB-hyl4]|uniref:Entericidin A/B family lipoprotein n=1 Tax=Natronomicrosphaera hydrolytica TaxID=3242702 RepID=A0ABV4U5Y4_9BACT